MIGQTVDHYRITEKLGEGGMGEVYLAEDTSLRRKVALKFLPAYLEHDETAQKRFIREARSAAAIDHPYICKIHEIGEVDRKRFIVMEYVQGHTLQDKLTQGRIPVKQALKIAAETAEAIDRAHQEGIVHRDLKPSNIMLAPDGHVKVMDFGLAKRMEREEENITAALTREGTTLGTLAYMSPEQLKGKAVDTRSDIFSFGVVLYELLTGVHPFRTGTQAETVNAILNEHPSALSRYTEDTSDILQHTIEKMLAKDAEERYQSIREVRTNLKKLTEKLSAPEVAIATVKARRSPWLGVGAVLAVMVALVLAFYFYQQAFVEEAAVDSVAVLPFTTTGEDPVSAALADGIPASISASLLKLKKLRLVKPASVLQRYRGKEIDPHVVSEEQGVRAVLIGNVQRLDDSLAVTVELIDGRDNNLIWGQPYSRKISDIFAVQEDTARQVVEALRLQLSEDEIGLLVQTGTENPEAYQAFLQGQYRMTRFSTEGWEAGKEAMSFYERAIELDPKYQEVYGRLAGLYAAMGSRGIDPNGYEKARAYADKVLEIDDSTVLAHQVKAQLLWRLDREWEAVEREYRKAVDLDPSFEIDGSFLEWMGLREERLAQLERRLDRADPLAVTQQGSLGWGFLFIGEYGRAIELSREVLSLEPEATDAYAMQSIIYDLKGMEEEAFEINLIGKSEEEAGELRAEFEKSGIEALHKRDLESRLKKPNTRPIGLVQGHLAVGEKDKAFEWLEKTWDRPLEGNEHSPLNPQFDPLRSDPRFEELLRKQNLPEEAIQRHLALLTR